MSQVGVKLLTPTGSRWFHITEAQARSVDTHPDGVNWVQIQRALTGMVALLADSPLFTLDERARKPARVYGQFIRYATSRPLRDLAVEYAKLWDRIAESGVGTSEVTITGEFVPEMKDTPIFKEYLYWRRTGDPTVLRWIHSFLVFIKKMDFEDPQFYATALRGWLSDEKDLSGFKFDPDALRSMESVLSWLIGEYRVKRFFPRFGPGAVAESDVRGWHEKVDSLSLPPKIRRFVKSYGSMVVNRWDDTCRPGDEVDPNHFRDSGVASKPQRSTSKQSFARKDLRTARSMAAEPNAYMYAQQGIMRDFVSQIRDMPLGIFVDLRDQTLSRTYAEFGSSTKLVDTIDLSSASDRLHSQLFLESAPLPYKYAVLSTRTSEIELATDRLPVTDPLYEAKPRTVRYVKLAPMGSALCFPTQCAYFTGATILAGVAWKFGIRMGADFFSELLPCLGDVESVFKRTFTNRREYEKGRLLTPRVYGDDIVCDTRSTPYLIFILEQLAFRVNREKSFQGGQCVREACGGYYWEGADITPLRYSLAFPTLWNGGSVVSSMVSLTNRAGDMGYRNLQRYLYHLTKSVRRDIPFSANREAGLAFFSKAPRNTHLKRRYNERYQRDEMMVTRVKVKERLFANGERPSSYSGDKVVKFHQRDRDAAGREGEKAYAIDAYLYLQWNARNWFSGTQSQELDDAPWVTKAQQRRCVLQRAWVPLE